MIELSRCRTSSRRQKLLYPRKRRYTGQPLRGYRSPKTARDPRYRPLKTIKIRGNERLSGQPLFDLGRQTAKGFAEPVEAFAVEGGEYCGFRFMFSAGRE